MPEVVQALNDSNPLLRAAAARSLTTSAPQRQLALAAPLLEDPVYDVRIAAAEIVANLPFTVADPNLDQQVRLAHEIWRASLLANAERPESLLGLAAWHINRRELAEAEKRFEQALLLEPRYTPSYVNYADFLRRSQRTDEAQAVLEDCITKGTEPAAAHHSLGLLMVSAGNSREALQHLATASQTSGGSARYAYVYAVALHDDGQVVASLDVLEASLRDNRWDPDTLQTMALYALASPTPARGLPAAEDLVTLLPHDPNAANLKAQLEAVVR